MEGLLSALLSLLVLAGAQQDAQASAEYRLLIAGRPIGQGTVWLYYYGWGYLQRTELGTIQQGAVRIELREETLKAIQTPQTPDAFLIAVEVPDVGWLRSADFTDPRANLASALRSLGTDSVSREDNTVTISIPSPVKQRIQILDADGNPRPGMALAISTLVSSTNHCGAHMNFSFGGHLDVEDVRRVVTDNEGRAEFFDPLEPLFLETPYYEDGERDGRRTLKMKFGIKLEPSRIHVVRQIWDAPATRPFRVSVVTSARAPVAGVEISETPNVDSCVSPMVAGTTDANGQIVLDLSPETVVDMFLGREGVEQRRPFTSDELKRLFESGRIDITLPPGNPIAGR
jgi:hypothetical protein